MAILDSDDFRRRARAAGESARAEEIRLAQSRKETAQYLADLQSRERARVAALEQQRKQIVQLGGELATAARGRVPYTMRWQPYDRVRSLIGTRIGGRVLASGWLIESRIAYWQDDVGTDLSQGSHLALVDNGKFAIENIIGTSTDPATGVMISRSHSRKANIHHEFMNNPLPWYGFSGEEILDKLGEFADINDLI